MREPGSAKNLTDQLVEEIREQIIKSDKAKGELFMTVDQITEHYGVSRTIAREAASQLQALGFLKGKQRLGLVVERPDVNDLMKQWLPIYSRSLGRQNIQDLAQLRYVLEVGAIGFAVANASPEQVKALTGLAERFEEITGQSGQTEEADRIELEFHGLILLMTGNPLIAGMHRVLVDYFEEAKSKNPKWRKVSADAIWEHKAIAAAIARGDLEQARSILRHHLENTLAELQG